MSINNSKETVWSDCFFLQSHLAGLKSLYFPLWLRAWGREPATFKRQVPAGDAIFMGLEATVEFPPAQVTSVLQGFIAQAKVRLTLREPKAWFQPTQHTIVSPDWIAYLPNSPGWMTRQQRKLRSRR